MQERQTGENPRTVFETTLVSEVIRFQSGMGDSQFRRAPHGVILEGARDYLGLNGDNSEGEHLVYMRAANRFLAEKGITDVTVGATVTDEVVYAPDGSETRQKYWRAHLLRKAQNGNQA